MRSHAALYVDAGYLITAAATRLTGSSLRRGVEVDYARLLGDLIDLVEKRTSLPVLRVYWYDAARNGKATFHQEQIALLPRVKLRLGRVGVEGEQKGVDLRIGLDMVGHSRNGAIDAMYLLSGDDDLTEAVEEAQAQGVQVVVLAVPTRGGTHHGVSRHLMLAADDLEVLDSGVLDASIHTPAPPVIDSPALLSEESPPPAIPPAVLPEPQPAVALAEPAPAPITPAQVARLAPTPTLMRPAGSTSGSAVAPTYVFPAPERTTEPERPELVPVIRDVATKTYEVWMAAATASQLEDLHSRRPSIPRDLDRALLVDLVAAIDEDPLSDKVRSALRAAFWEVVDRS